MSSCVASGLSSVWSMRAEIPPWSGGQNPGAELARVAPTASAFWTNVPQWSGHGPQASQRVQPGSPVVDGRRRA